MMDPEDAAHSDVIFLLFSHGCTTAMCVYKAIHESNGRLKRANSLTGYPFCQCDLGGLRLQLTNRFGLKCCRHSSP